LDFAKQVRAQDLGMRVHVLTLRVIFQRGWLVDLTRGLITFTQKGEEKLEIPKEKLIENNLAYARELEQIV